MSGNETDRSGGGAPGSPSPHHDIAQQFAARGWYVLPLVPGTKTPPGNCLRCAPRRRGRPNPQYVKHQGTAEECRCIQAGRWCHGVHAATTDPDTISRWWTHNPQLAVGIATGRSRLLVVDLDNHVHDLPPRPKLLPGIDLPPSVQPAPGWTGETSLSTLAALLGHPDPLSDPPTLTVATPSGGTHLWYQVPDGMAWKPESGLLGWQVDIRCSYSYALAPGVTTRKGTYAVTSQSLTPAALPDWLATELERTGHRRTVKAHRPRPAGWTLTVKPGDQDDAARDAERVLEDLANTLEGGRNRRAFLAARSLGGLVGAGLMDEQEARDGLLAAAEAAGLEAWEAEPVIDRGLDNGMDDPRRPRRDQAATGTVGRTGRTAPPPDEDPPPPPPVPAHDHDEPADGYDWTTEPPDDLPPPEAPTGADQPHPAPAPHDSHADVPGPRQDPTTAAPEEQQPPDPDPDDDTTTEYANTTDAEAAFLARFTTSPLTDAHRARLHAAAITDQVLDQAAIDTTTGQVHPVLTASSPWDGPGTLFPLAGPDHVSYVFRPDHILTTPDGGLILLRSRTPRPGLPVNQTAILGPADPEDAALVVLVDNLEQALTARSWAPPEWCVIAYTTPAAWRTTPRPQVKGRQVVICPTADVDNDRDAYDDAADLGRACAIEGASTVLFMRPPRRATLGTWLYAAAEEQRTGQLVLQAQLAIKNPTARKPTPQRRKAPRMDHDRDRAVAPEAEAQARAAAAAEADRVAEAFGLDGVTIPAGWRVKGTGVWDMRMTRFGPAEEKITDSPLVVTRILVDPEGDRFVELAWLDRDRGRVVRRLVPRGVVRRGRALVKEMATAGLPSVGEATASGLERWLADFESANVGVIEVVDLRRWLGWQPDDTFLATPDGAAFEPLFPEQAGPANHHTGKGTPEGWQEAARIAERHPVARMCLAVALAAPLLRVLGLGSFTVDVSNMTTTGKTSVLLLSLSAWGEATEHSPALGTWAATPYAIERRLNLVRGLPTIMDETQLVAERYWHTIGDLIYTLASNRGQARGGGYANELAWETILLASGERALLSFTHRQGASARVLGCTQTPFDNGADPDRIRALIAANHGHAGPRFVALLQALTEDGLEELRARHAQLTQWLAKGCESALAARRAPMIAALVVAEEWAIRWGVLPFAATMPPETWLSLFPAETETDNRPEQALAALTEWVASRPHELWRRDWDAYWSDRWGNAPGISPRPPAQGWIGSVTDSSGERRVALRKEIVKKVLADAGHEFDAVIGAWMAAGYINVTKRRPPHSTLRPMGGKKTPLIELTRAGFAFGDGDDPDPEDNASTNAA